MKRPLLFTFARVLLIGNLVILVGAFFALPAYQKMHPHTFGNAEIVLFEALTALDVCGAFAVLRGRVIVGIALFGLTSLVWCVDSIIGRIDAGRMEGVLWTPLIAFWDVALLLVLARIVARQRNSSSSELQA